MFAIILINYSREGSIQFSFFVFLVLVLYLFILFIKLFDLLKDFLDNINKKILSGGG